MCKSCPKYNKTIISIEYGKDVERRYPIVLVHYYFDGETQQIIVASHGNCKANSTQNKEKYQREAGKEYCRHEVQHQESIVPNNQRS